MATKKTKISETKENALEEVFVATSDEPEESVPEEAQSEDGPVIDEDMNTELTESPAAEITKVQVNAPVQAYSKPNFNASTMAGMIHPGIYTVTDIMQTRQGRFIRLHNKKYILEGANTILK